MEGRTYSLLECVRTDTPLLLALHRVVDQDACPKDVQLSVGEKPDAGQEGGARILERVWQAEAVDEAAEDGERPHEHEQPEPPGLAADAAHVQDAVREQLRRRLAELVAKVEDHHALGRLRARIPRRQRPQAAGDEAGLGHAQQEARGDEHAVALLEGLEGADGAEEEQLQRQPLARADAVQDHVGRDFEQHDAQREHLLADVELVLRHANVLHEVVGEGVGNVPSVEFCGHDGLAASAP